MRLVTAEEMKNIDQAAINDYGIPGIVLMENAGIQVVKAVKEMLGDLRGKVISIIVGKGNNGGDGLVTARHLLNQGAQIKVLLMSDPSEIQGDARINLEIWHKMGQPVYQINQGNGINILKLALLSTDLVVDGLFGTGFRGEVRTQATNIIELINNSNIPVIAIDIPSGVEADTGKVNGACIKATQTVTFGLPKLGLVIEPGVSYTGILKIVDISLPAALKELGSGGKQLLTRENVAGWLKPRKADGHKGTYGRVFIVAGSRGMVGAARLTAKGALRSGAGLVTLAVPDSILGMAADLDEAMTRGLPDEGTGFLSEQALEQILEGCQNADILALGPGLTTSPETVSLVRKLLPRLTIPTVIDADALNALAGATDLIKEIQVPVVITPHPGEMARLLNVSIPEVQVNRLQIALDAVDKMRSVVVLKGAGTIIASPAGNVYINSTGNPGMATGGSGDVLTGIIAGLAGQGLKLELAAAAAVYIHGRAGDLAAGKLGQHSTLPGDILAYLHCAFQELFQQ